MPATELAEAPLVHGAVTIGECSACHSMHGAQHERLLREVDPAVLLGPYDAQNYALCFACHDKRLADTAGATQFRNGETNLHAAHLRAGEKAGGCADCHAVHSGTQARLVVQNFWTEDPNPDLSQCLAGIFLSRRRRDGAWEAAENWPVECRTVAHIGMLDLRRPAHPRLVVTRPC